MYRLLILAPSAGGKSALMRYLRASTDLQIAETDEEVLKANDGVWPDDVLKDEVLIPQTTMEIINRASVVYFASYIPDDLIKEARSKGFKLITLDVSLEVLRQRNEARMREEGYDDVSQWQGAQLDNFAKLKRQGLIDEVIDGNNSIEEVAREVMRCAIDQQE